MKRLKKSRIILISVSVLILAGCICMTGYLFFSNYQNIRLFRQAEENFHRGDEASINLAESQLLRLITFDDDNEAAYIMLGKIAGKRKVYPEQVYYCHMACRLNPLSRENKKEYIKSLCFARYFDRLENFLTNNPEFDDDFAGIRFYAAGHNGNIHKHKFRNDGKNPFALIADLIFRSKELTAVQKLEKLGEIDSAGDDFLKQEIIAVKAELHLSMQNFTDVEKLLKEAYALNEYAFAPVLGRFYARYNSFGDALAILEKYLALYHDPLVAIQTAEFYCLLNKTDKIAELRKGFQADSGNMAMVCCYYFDTLIAFAKNDLKSLKELSVPLRGSLKTPLAAFIFLCADLQGNDLSAIQERYTAIIEQRNYLDLQKRADNMVSDYLKYAFSNIRGSEDKLLPLAQQLYQRKPEVFTAKLILLLQKKRNEMNISLLKEALKNFSKDQGIIKIGIENYLRNDPDECERLIAVYKKNFPEKSGDMLRYEIILAMQKRDFNRVSALFQSSKSPEILSEYWNFASSTMRESDLMILEKNRLYQPFCQALLLLKKGKTDPACDILEKSDAKGNLPLLFFAAKTLAENGRNQSALEKYSLFPEKSPYQTVVLMNMAELHAENGDLAEALKYSRRSYELAPHLPETQFCYADKLFKSGNLMLIPDVVKLSPGTLPYRRKMEKMWISGMEARIRTCDFNTRREKLRELCRQLLVIAPDNIIALENLKKLKKMPQ